MLDPVVYPRTLHIEGSRVPAGTKGDGVCLADLPDGLHVWEEKLDGTFTSVEFTDDADMVLRTGSNAIGNTRDRSLTLFQEWASSAQDELFDRLGTRYVIFFEWMAAKHTIFYDALPHFAFEEDIFDRKKGAFLSTTARHALLDGCSFPSVPVLHMGAVPTQNNLRNLVRPSVFKTEDWLHVLSAAADVSDQQLESVLSQTDMSEFSEGLYLKVEDPETDTVIGRYKFVREDFLKTILNSGSHWRDRPLILNKLSHELEPTYPFSHWHQR